MKKLRKREMTDLGHTGRSEEKERKRIISEQRRSERDTDKLKQKNERKALKEERKEVLENQSKNSAEFRKSLEERIAFESRERRYRKKRRRRLLRFYARICRRNTIQTISIFNPLNLPILIRYVSDNRSLTKEFLIITIHSTLLFTAAYFLIFLISSFTSAISGLFFEYKSIVYYYEVLWLVKPSQWFGDSVKMIYSSGPLLSGIIAAVLAIIFSYIRTEKGLAKLFILWSLLHGFNSFLGSLLIGSLFGRGFGYAIIWSYVSDTQKVIYSIISITALIILGILTSKSFLISANSYYPMLETRKQRSFIWAQVILPFILGNMLIAVIMFPEMLIYNLTVSLCLGIAILPVALGSRFKPSLYFEEEEIRIKIKMKTILYSIAFIVIYRIVLNFGIPLG